MNSRQSPPASNPWSWEARRTMGYGWLQCHVAALPLSPAVLNSGLAGGLALVVAAGWYAILHAPGSLARLLSQ